MKAIFRLSAISLMLMLVLQAMAWADTIEGRVAQTDWRTLSLVVYDAQGRPYPNQLNLLMDNQTEFQGVSSAAELRPNDAVSVDVRQGETGVWRADRVTRFRQINARPATQKTSSALGDMLGNPVARGALLGAATGAIASGASGGKVGKGALIGAGAGAAAGLLENIFSQRSTRSQDTDNQ